MGIRHYLIAAAVVLMTIEGGLMQGNRGKCDNDTAISSVPYLYKYLGSELPVEGTTASTGSYRMCYEAFNEEQGSCCKLNTFNSTFSSMMTNAVNNWDKFNRDLVYVRRRVGFVSQLYSNNTREDIRTFVGELKDNTKFSVALDGLTVSKILSILESFFTFEPDMKKFRDSGKFCFERGMFIRGQIFCYACASGDVYTKYFSEMVDPDPLKTQFKFSWNENTCQNLAIDCISSWKFISNSQLFLQISYMLEHYMKSFTYEKDEDGNTYRTVDATKLTNKYNKMNIYYSGKSHKDVQNSLEVCATGEVDDTCTTNDVKTICSSFFNFLNGEIGLSIKEVVDFEVDGGEFNSSVTISSIGLTEFNADKLDLLLKKSMIPPRFTSRKDLEFWAVGGIKSSYIASALLQMVVLMLVYCALY